MRHPGSSQYRGDSGFNPHPTRRPDATSSTRPQRQLLLAVSILIRPEGRMRRFQVPGHRAYTPFQSSSDPKAGCDICDKRRRSDRLGVSILIRPEGRMRHYGTFEIKEANLMFQSSSDPKAGCDLPSTHVIRLLGMFQSSSDPKAGCDGDRRRHDHPGQGFNPHPTRRPDATRATAVRPCLPFCSFNPHPTRRPDATRTPARHPGEIKFQSSSDPKAGCDGRLALLAALPTRPCGRVSILIRPEGRMRPTGSRRSKPLKQFQSSSDPKAGCDP